MLIWIGTRCINLANVSYFEHTSDRAYVTIYFNHAIDYSHFGADEDKLTTADLTLQGDEAKRFLSSVQEIEGVIYG